MNKTFSSSLIALFLLTTLCFALEDSIATIKPEEFFGSPNNLQLVTTAQAITVFRIIDSRQLAIRENSVKIDGYTCDKTSPVVRGREVAMLINALLDKTNFDSNKLCIFKPGLIFRFSEGARVLDVIICFHCREMVMMGNGEVVRRPFRWGSIKLSFRKDAYTTFTKVAQKAFPNDPEFKLLTL